MDEKRIFAVLGIEKTRDKGKIRDAYRRILQQVNPEDDPEGFKRLRETYEAALKYADTPDQEMQPPTDHSPVGQWMERVRAVYFSLPRRLDESEWEGLIREDVCVALDYCEEARWRLFTFLRDHYQLPSYIFRILDREFHIQGDVEQFKEHLPLNFVEYLLRKARDTEGTTDFDYAHFQGEDDADYDGFLEMFHELQVQMAREDGQAALRTIQTMDRYGISHPLYELQKAYACLYLEQYQEALAQIRPLMEQCPDSDRIQVAAGEILYKCGLHEEAERQLAPYGDRNYYLVEKYLCLCLEEKGDVTAAIFHAQNAMKGGRGAELQECLSRLDERFLEEFPRKEREDAVTDDDVNCLLSVLNRGGRANEALDYLEQHPDRARRLDNLRHCRVVLYFQLQRYEDALRECDLWKQELEDGSQTDPQERQRQELFLHRFQGEALYQMGRAGEEGAYLKALAMYAVVSEREPDNLDYQQRILDIMIAMEKYEDAVKQADYMIAQNSQWYPAYVQKQRACFELGRAQEVIDCFYAARKIYAAAAVIYEKAADVFIRYRQYNDAESIFRLARESGVDSISLDILRLGCLSRREERNLQDLTRQGRRSDFRLDKELTELIKSVKAKYREHPAGAQDMCLLYRELGIAEQIRRHDKECVRYLRRALKYQDRPDCHYLLAKALHELEEYDKALEQYHIYEKSEEVREDFCINIARCCRAAGRREESIEYFKKALVFNPENQEANGAIANLYRGIMWDSGNRYYGRLAMPYSDRQMELTPDSAFHIRRRAWLLRDMGQYEEALETFKRSLALAESHYTYEGMGKTLNNLGRCEEALECLRKAIELGGSQVEALVYWEAGSGLCSVEKYAEAEEWFLRGIEQFRGNPDDSLYFKLNWLYRKIGAFEKARAICREMWEVGIKDEEDYEIDCLVLDQLLGIQGELSYVERARRMAEKYDSVDSWNTLAQCCEFETGDLTAALAAARTALEKARERQAVWDNSGVLFRLMRYCVLLGQRESAAEYAEIFCRELEKECSRDPEKSAVEQYLDDINSWSENAYNLALCEIARGNLIQAQGYLQWMKSKPLCAKCYQCVCQEVFELQGYLCEVRGERAQALANYRRVLELHQGSLYMRSRIRALEAQV